MSNIKLRELPSITSTEIEHINFRGKTSSEQFNAMEERVLFDIMNCYNILKEFDNKLCESDEYKTIENCFTQMNIDMLSNKVQELKRQIELYENNFYKQTSLYAKDIKALDKACDVNTEYNCVSINTNNTISKLYLYDKQYDLTTIPNTLKVNITPQSNNVNIIDNDFRNCMDNKLNSYWVRKIISNSTEPVSTSIEITLPDNIISSRNINSILLKLFPSNSLNIKSIEYKLNAGWRTIPGFNSYHNAIAFTSKNILGETQKNYYLKESNTIKLCFGNIDISKIKITLEQPNYVVKNNNKIFYLGIKSLEINQETYINNECKFEGIINFDNDVPKMITNIDTIFNNEELLSDKSSLISYELYSLDKNDKATFIDSPFPLKISNNKYKIICKLKFDKSNNINPNLYCININYKYIS